MLQVTWGQQKGLTQIRHMGLGVSGKGCVGGNVKDGLAGVPGPTGSYSLSVRARNGVVAAGRGSQGCLGVRGPGKVLNTGEEAGSPGKLVSGLGPRLSWERGGGQGLDKGDYVSLRVWGASW